MNVNQRMHEAGVRLAAANGHNVALPLSGPAYTSGRFEETYESFAAREGRRPAFTVIVALGEGMEVRTTASDEAVAREIVAALESVA